MTAPLQQTAAAGPITHDPVAHEALAGRLEAAGYRVLRENSVAKKWAFSHFADWYRARTRAERVVINTYLSVDYCVNWPLRQASARPGDPLPPPLAHPETLDDPNIRFMIDTFDRLMGKTAAPERLAVTRLFNLKGHFTVSARWSARMDALRVGDVLQDSGYLSCALRWDWGVGPVPKNRIWVAEPRAHGLPQHHAVILLEAGAPLLPIWNYCDLTDDPRRGWLWTEVLLPRGLALRVLERPEPANNHRWVFAPVDGRGLDIGDDAK